MTKILIDDRTTHTTPQLMMQAIDDNFDELFDNVAVGFNPAEYGAVGDETTDDTTALQSCLTAAEAAGTAVIISKIHKITDKLTIPPGIAILGHSRDTCGFTVSKDDFNLSATGILDLQISTSYGPRIENIQITTDMDTTETVRSNLTDFPPAIRAVDCPRFFLKNIRINKAMVGIDATGNSGGAHITDCEIGAYEYGLKIDGALDFMYIDNIEFWPFGIADTDSADIYADGTTIALNCVDCDGIAIGTLTTFWCETRIVGGFGSIGSILCDGRYSRLLVGGGCRLAVGTMYSTSDANDDYALWVTGTDTHVSVGTLWFTNNVDITNTFPGQIILDTASAKLLISNLFARTVGTNTRVFYGTAGTLSLSNAYVNAPTTSDMTNALFYATDAIMNIDNLTVAEKTDGTGDVIECTTDINHKLSNIMALGWTIDLAADYLKPQLTNISSATATVGERLVGNRKIFEFNITLDSSGNGSTSTNFVSHDQVRAMTVVADTGTYWFCPPPQFLIIGSGTLVYDTDDTNYGGYVLTIRVEMELT